MLNLIAYRSSVHVISICIIFSLKLAVPQWTREKVNHLAKSSVKFFFSLSFRLLSHMVSKVSIYFVLFLLNPPCYCPESWIVSMHIEVYVLLCGQTTHFSRYWWAAVYAGTWQNLPIPLHPPPPTYTIIRHPSSSQSASHTAPSLRHLHISSSLGQSIKLNPCLGWLTNGWWAHIVTELFI